MIDDTSTVDDTVLSDSSFSRENNIEWFTNYRIFPSNTGESIYFEIRQEAKEINSSEVFVNQVCLNATEMMHLIC